MSEDVKQAKAKARAAKAQAKKKEKDSKLSAVVKEHGLDRLSEESLAEMIAAAQKVAKAKKNRERNADLSIVRGMCRKHGFTASNLKGYLVVKAKKAPKDVYAYYVEHLKTLSDKHYSELKRAMVSIDEEKSKAGKAA